MKISWLTIKNTNVYNRKGINGTLLRVYVNEILIRYNIQIAHTDKSRIIKRKKK